MKTDYLKGSALLFTVLLGYIISIHAGVRASTRLSLYLIIIFMIIKLIKHYNRVVFSGKRRTYRKLHSGQTISK